MTINLTKRKIKQLFEITIRKYIPLLIIRTFISNIWKQLFPLLKKTGL